MDCQSFRLEGACRDFGASELDNLGVNLSQVIQRLDWLQVKYLLEKIKPALHDLILTLR